MKKVHKSAMKKYGWTVILIIILCLSSAYTLLDAFVIPKAYATVEQSQANYLATVDLSDQELSDSTIKNEMNNAEDITYSTSSDQSIENQTDPIITEYSYLDENISIKIEKISGDDVEFYVADIRIADSSYLKTAFAQDTFGKNITQTTSAMAEANDAIFAINGDYYGFRDTGLVIRNGILYRDVSNKSSYDQSLAVNREGDLEIVNNSEVSGTTLIESGILQGFTFGPVLVEDGQITAIDDTQVSKKTNPRTAIGQISALHYLFIVVDGRSAASNGMTLTELAQEFINRGATIAYNLDGGGSSAMWLNGNLVNNPTDGKKIGERNISDIIYIGY